MNYFDLGEKLINFGKINGATQMQVNISSGNEYAAEIRNGEIERLTESGSKGLSFKVLVGNRKATASSNDFSIEVLEGIIRNAITRAKLSGEDVFSLLPEEHGELSNADLELFNDDIFEVSSDHKIQMAKEIERIALADKRIVASEGSYFSDNYGEVFLINSNGFQGSHKYTVCSAGVYLHAGEEGNNIEDGWHCSSLSFKGLDTIENIANTAIHRATRLIGAKKVKTQSVPVIFEPVMTSSLLGFLAGCLNGHSIYMNQSFLAGKSGEKIAGDNINIISDGLIPGGFGSRLFDADGVPTGRFYPIRDGILESYLLDTYSGRKLGMKSTGNASGANNFFLENGTLTQEEIIKSTERGLLLVRTIGQGTVPTTGDFSKGAFGLWIENGEIVHPVAEVTISGNLGTMLRNIDKTGDDMKFDKSITGPTIRINGMTISGI